MTKKRNFRAEYLRRITRGLQKGLSKSQARGHARIGETVIKQKSAAPIADDRMQIALRTLRKESLAKAAKAAGISPERLRRHAIERHIITKSGRRWRTGPDLPRNVLIFSKGKSLAITVSNFEAASVVGRYMAAVGRFLETNDRTVLNPFIEQSVRDVAGKEHPFETRPNALYRLSAAGEHTFEQIYRIVI